MPLEILGPLSVFAAKGFHGAAFLKAGAGGKAVLATKSHGVFSHTGGATGAEKETLKEDVKKLADDVERATKDFLPPMGVLTAYLGMKSQDASTILAEERHRSAKFRGKKTARLSTSNQRISNYGLFL